MTAEATTAVPEAEKPVKYRFTGAMKEFEGRVVRRIEVLTNHAWKGYGASGGWIEKEENLTQEGSCLVLGEAVVMGDAKVEGDAVVYGNAVVGGNARISGRSQVYDRARVDDLAMVLDHASVSGCARLAGSAVVEGSAGVGGRAEICGHSVVGARARVEGDAKLRGNAKIFGFSVVRGAAVVDAGVEIHQTVYIGSIANIQAPDDLIILTGFYYDIVCWKGRVSIGCQERSFQEWIDTREDELEDLDQDDVIDDEEFRAMYDMVMALIREGKRRWHL